MSFDLTEDKSILVQVMAWCRQATSHYLTQCWPRSVSPYGIIRPQWFKGEKQMHHKTSVSTMIIAVRIIQDLQWEKLNQENVIK